MIFSKTKKLLDDIRKAKDELELVRKDTDKLIKQNKQLLSKVESSQKRGGVLLLSDLNEELIEKLQSLTDDNVVILFLGNDNTRIEIRKTNVIYKRNNGGIF